MLTCLKNVLAASLLLLYACVVFCSLFNCISHVQWFVLQNNPSRKVWAFLVFSLSPSRNLLPIQQRHLKHQHRAASVSQARHINWDIYPINGWTVELTDLVYLPHSVAFCNCHSEAVAMYPWRRLSTRDLCSSSLQHGTIVPWVNGVVFVSFVPISVPVIINERKKRMEIWEQF